ncbi:MAG: D-alanyl-D-alanine carboxypeptidase/D-alanyl-D-alanine-endopeptidase [Ignavibacteriaceae bacterium]|nr:D-alanyl-D-alanine carboxypeptidase/D-alanyl-D-alanine-endopeptidase [Ignavibacteriaceae bacterium]
MISLRKKIIYLIIFLCSSQIFSSSKEEVKAEIENLLNNIPVSTKIGMLIYNPILRDTIFQLNHTMSMIPASNTKLFTTAVALANLNGSFEISTKIFSDDFDIKDGIINGNLYIKGFGNSTFSSDDMDQFVLDLKRLGIKHINGNIIGDDTYFDNVYKRDDWIADEVANVKLPPISALTVDRNRKIIRKRRGRRFRTSIVAIENPPLNAATILRTKLIANGITVEKNARTDITPGKVLELSKSSISLRDLIKLINKHSDNFLAEGLFKTIGAEASQVEGNAFYSTQAILDFIDDNGIYSTGTSIVDGSGISRFDQITPGAIVGLLEVMYFDINNYSDFYNSLSIAGVDGTLRHRMIGTLAESNFRGKTGSLNGVTSLAGYLRTKTGDDLIVSIIFEYLKGGSDYYKSIEDDIIEALCNLTE